MKPAPVSVRGHVRCAIYTRKSSEEGLEQDFNSLHAQREACAAYILSQASEGWSALPEVYDDGGLSGGTLERPALQRLLGEVAARRVDIIVVYKVDRLTRSLLDFSKLVEAFDKAGVSFVSVTQSFNTTTSMGRLTLNMLLSFAQFEREVTAERIRDKIAASKAKGMWMGGTPPLGYEPDGRSLKIVEDHAALVRDIFARYLALGNVRQLADELARDGTVAPVRQRKSGQTFGGLPFGRGQLYTLLANPIYIGQIAHGTARYPGTHSAIVPQATWDAVQAQLAANLQGTRSRTRSAYPSLFASNFYDRDGGPLIASHASKGSQRYRYYITPPSPTSALSTRIPAPELERAVCNTLADALERPFDLAAQLGAVAAGLTPAFRERAAALAGAVPATNRATIASLVERIDITEDGFELTCATLQLAQDLGLAVPVDDTPEFRLLADVRLQKSGRALRLVDATGEAIAPSETLVGLIVKARRWWLLLREGDEDITTLAPRLGVNTSYMGRVLRLAFLSPQVVDAVLAGRTRADLKGAELLTQELFTPVWREQAEWLLPAKRYGSD